VLLLSGLNIGDVTFARIGDDLFVKITSSGEQVKVEGQFDAGGVEQVKFADGTTWDRAQIQDASWFQGTSAAETLQGTGAADRFDGGGGNDTLVGGDGGDTYLYGVGSGDDTIRDYSFHSGTDTLQLSGLNSADVSLTRSGNDLFVKIISSGEQVKVENQFDGGGVEQVKFADGTIWDRAQILDASWVRGTSAAETLQGTGDADKLDGGGGNETLVGGDSGDTYLYGVGSGDDTIQDYSFHTGTDTLQLSGLNSTDVLFSRSGNHLFVEIISSGEQVKVEDQFLGEGVEQVKFADGTTWDRAQILDAASWIRGTSAAETLQGTGDADKFDGGGGNDTLVGGDSGDIYLYGVGSGDDTIQDWSFHTGTDTLQLSGLNSADVQFSRSGNHLLVKIISSGEQVKVEDQFLGEGVEQVKFADGTTWDRAQILDAASWIRGTSANETINGSSDADKIDGAGGNDMLVGANGGDTYLYEVGSGNDTIQDWDFQTGTDTLQLAGLNSTDVLFNRSGNHLFVKIISSGEQVKIEEQFSGGGVEQVKFADGTTWDRTQILDASWVRGTSAGETINGTSAADKIDGGGGNDTLVGADGGDTYLYGLGSGNDTIQDWSFYTGTDTLQLSGLNGADVEFSRSGNHLFVKIVSSGEQVKVEDHFSGNGVEQVKFADGTTWDRAQILDAASWIRGTSANETINGTSDADKIDGGGGNDTLVGGNGGDTYLYKVGSGNDTIQDWSFYTGTDTLQLAGLNIADVLFTRSGSHLFVTIVSSGEQVKVEEHFSGNGIEQVKFADGTTWDRTQILDASWIRGTSAGETINGSSDADKIDGAGGDDTLVGANGGDTYLYGAGSGNDTIQDWDFYTGTDTLQLAGLNSADVSFTRSGSHLFVTLNSSGEQVKVDSHFSGSGVEQVKFADGTTWDRTAIAQNAWINGTSGNDNIAGGSGIDAINGGAGNDTVNGGGGNDIIVGGSGNDTVTGGADNDTFVFKSGFGLDTITDFTAGAGSTDVIRIEDSLFADFAAVQAASAQVGGNVVITLDASNTITLQNVTLANLHQDDFQLA
jgi:Ca2+-binding RTX toxin-like protein